MCLQMLSRGSRKFWEGKTARSEVITDVLKPGVRTVGLRGHGGTVVSPLGQNGM